MNFSLLYMFKINKTQIQNSHQPTQRLAEQKVRSSAIFRHHLSKYLKQPASPNTKAPAADPELQEPLCP